VNALLVSPLLPLSFWNFKSILKIIKKKITYIPLGLITVASLLPRHWTLKLVDLNAEKLTDQVVKWADLVLVSAMIVQKASVREIVDRVHDLGKKVVLGGPIFDHCVEKNFMDVDFKVLGEAELTLPRFIRDFESGAPQAIYRSDEKCDIRNSPVPRWDLLNMKLYASMSVQSSRGCPFSCEFCDIPFLQGNKYRTKTQDQMINEFSGLYDNGWRGRVFIADDNFIGNRPRARELLKALADWQQAKGYPFVINTETSIDLARDEALMGMMVEAGFKALFVGLETPDENTLQKCGKYQNTGVNLLEAVRSIQRCGLEVTGGFIVGFDSDTQDIFERQIKFIQESGIVTAMISILYALPGTRLYLRLKKEGRLINVDCTGSNTTGSITFIPRMGVETLYEGYMSVVNYIYSPKGYYERILNFIKFYKPAKKRSFSTADLSAFLRSIIYLGILNKGQAQLFYWKAVLQAIFFKHEYLGEIIEHAVFAHHFQKQAELINGRSDIGRLRGKEFTFEN
jgi:radical SAM superfamily enzyme YgiQ (UPF0313 family)